MEIVEFILSILVALVFCGEVTAGPLWASWGIMACKPCAIARCRRAITCEKGKLRDACNCCDVCAKVEGEECGGKWYMHGRCDQGLTCDISGSEPTDPKGKCTRKSGTYQILEGKKYPAKIIAATKRAIIVKLWENIKAMDKINQLSSSDLQGLCTLNASES